MLDIPVGKITLSLCCDNLLDFIVPSQILLLSGISVRMVNHIFIFSMPVSGATGDPFSFVIFVTLIMQVMTSNMSLAMLNLGPAHLLSLGFQK